MPIRIGAEIRRPTDEEFKYVAYRVMACVFDVHNEMGRFFDEKIYQREIASRLADARTGVSIKVEFDGFQKIYFLDLLVANSAVFELKVTDSLAPKHRAQLLNYLLLCGLPHGKLVNLRPETVTHEFVNSMDDRQSRTHFSIDAERWEPLAARDEEWKRWLIGALRDWGTGLDRHLYEDAVTQMLGGEEIVNRNVEVTTGNGVIGVQKARLTGPGVGLDITTLNERTLLYEDHLRRLLEHLRLRAIQWVNIARGVVQFATIVSKQ